MFGLEELGLTGGLFAAFILCVLAVCIFEFVNGFHDTANAVATVIYTKSLDPLPAVIWSGLMNFVGLMLSSYLFGMGVAGKIASLLPLEAVMSNSTNEAIALVLAAILAAIIWNLGTWYFGIPCSSSHTLIGALLGVGMAYSYLPHASVSGVNWNEAIKIGYSLLFSPLFGFSMAIALMFLLKSFIKNKAIFKEPEEGARPPLWIRAILFCTCTLVSFFHGYNDGQKGIGLMLIVLFAFLPAQHALSPDFDKNKFQQEVHTIYTILDKESQNNYLMERTLCLEADKLREFSKFVMAADLKQSKQILSVRKQIGTTVKGLKKLLEEPNLFEDPKSKKQISSSLKVIGNYTAYIPTWVILMVALCLGLGTMVGWKRIVVTIGEKIGKRHMTYAEGASAELIASITIGLASKFSLPVSTTHVLSSGVAGAMVASKGTKNLQKGTVKNIVLAWVLTLPATIILSAVLYYIFRMFI